MVRRLFSLLTSLFFVVSVSAQMYVWKDGNVIFRMDEVRPDSITFEHPTKRYKYHEFSVATGKTVYFSAGNLQYVDCYFEWQFAEHQYDIIGSDNSNISEWLEDPIDLFGWATSGWEEHEASNYSTDYTDYIVGGDWRNSLVGTYSWADWGVPNRILNGGDTEGLWRTLTTGEWNYLLALRNNASKKFALATIGTQKGLIILPDDWVLPTGLTFTPSVESRLVYENELYIDEEFLIDNFTDNVYTTDEWMRMESAGAVFLPAAGYRWGKTVSNVNKWGYYWSSTSGSDEREGNVCGLSFYGWGVTPKAQFSRARGASVRLVRDVR